MSEIFCEKFDSNNPEHLRAPHRISEWTADSDSVLYVDPSEILRHPYGVLVRRPGLYSVIGYGAIKELSQDGEIGQLGTLVSSPHIYIGADAGIAKACVKHILQNAPAELPDMRAAFAYGNSASTPLFLSLGGVLLGERPEPSPTGCNNVIDLTPAMDIPGVDIPLADILRVNEAGVN